MCEKLNTSLERVRERKKMKITAAYVLTFRPYEFANDELNRSCHQKLVRKIGKRMDVHLELKYFIYIIIECRMKNVTQLKVL